MSRAQPKRIEAKRAVDEKRHLSPAHRPGGPVVVLRSPGRTHQHSQRWAAELAAALKTETLVVRLDAFTDGTTGLAAVLSTLDPRVVVLAFTAGWPADSVAQLANASGVPCLVARAPQPGKGVLGATRLDDEHLPVLDEAAAWARLLSRPLTFLHNTEASVIEKGHPSLERQLNRLAAQQGAELVMTQAHDPVAGILEAARAAEADLIVVGTRPARGGDRQIAPRVASMAKRSVLIVPIAAGQPKVRAK